MIRNMRAKNFKSWKDTGDLRVAPITGFFGTNSSGKTSLLQMLLLMKQTAQSSDPKQVLFFGDENSLVNLGTFQDVVHNHSNDANLEFSLSWYDEEHRTYVSFIDGNNSPMMSPLVHFTVSLYTERERLFVDSFRYSVRDFFIGLQRIEGKKQYELLLSDKLKTYTRDDSLDDETLSPIKFYDFSWGDITLQTFPTGKDYRPLKVGDATVSVSGYSLEALLEKIAYLGPLRDYPRRFYVWGGDSPSDVGKRGERAIFALLSNRNEGGENYLEQKVASLLQRMGLIHSFSLRPIAPGRRDYEVVVKKTASSAEVLITDIGFGVSQILPVLVLCYHVPEGSIIIFEQPEIHLHPSAQADLADVFIEVAKERKIQIIFESHSEYLLHRLQRRIAEEKLSKDDAALYFCSMGEESSQIGELRLDEYGNIANWPKDFFGDSTGDLVAMTEAAMRRKLTEQT